MKKKRVKKRTLGLFVLLYSLLLIIGSTYAWVTMADQRVNKMEVKRLEILLTGNEQNEIITPALSVKKDVAIRNDGTSQALVRISLSEILYSFEIDTTDQTGNGHILTQKQASSQPVDVTQSETWQVGETYQVTPESYWIGKTRTDNPIFQWPQTTRPSEFQSALILDMPQVTTVQPAPEDLGETYWLYYCDYFYYSKPLRPGEWTTPLVHRLQVSPSLENRQKGSLYQLKAEGEAYSASKAAISESPGWNLGTNNPVFTMLKEKVD
ncbi:hypothetical protein [Vagococcus fluvialis]|uniref:hypothetical protein n=1 Tax=Vagococcus fluvialis TaxID=2738 RepID=UPI00379510B8